MPGLWSFSSPWCWAPPTSNVDVGNMKTFIFCEVSSLHTRVLWFFVLLMYVGIYHCFIQRCLIAVWLVIPTDSPFIVSLVSSRPFLVQTPSIHGGGDYR